MFKAYGLYTHIRANRLRSAFLLVGFIVLLHALMFSFALLFEAFNEDNSFPVLIARAWADLWRGWPIATAAALIWFGVAYLFHQTMIDFATGAGGISREEAPRLYNLLENLCISRGIPIPALKIIEDDALNAYASGIREGHYNVTVTRGLLQNLNDAELEAVLAHELTHIRNRDVQLMVIAVIFAGVFAFVGDLMFRNWNFPFGFSPRRSSDSDDRDRGGGGGAALAILLALLVILLSWGASVLIRFAISRSREYLADAGSVELTKNPDAMISALRKIEAHATIPDMPSRMHAFFIESPAITPETGWLATHPSVEDRIVALVDFAGGQDLVGVRELSAPDQPLIGDSALEAPEQAEISREPSFLPPDGRSPLDPPQPPGPWG
jgi:heat shock protein HtpX